MINLIKEQKKIKNRGFTLVETLVAISIFSISVMAMVNISSTGVLQATYAKNKMTAGFLAQEGIEYMRNMRDTFVLYPDPSSGESNASEAWNNFNILLNSSGCTNTTNGCYFDYTNIYNSNPSPIRTFNGLIACPTTTCTHLLYITSGFDGGEYRYDGSPSRDSGFSRKIIVYENGDVTRVNSTVYWSQGIRTYHVTLSEDLYNWVE